MAEIVGLRGAPIPKSTEPVESLVKTLETYLEQARSGHLRGVAFALVTADNVTTTGWSGDADNRLMMAAVTILNYRLAKNLGD